MSANLRVTFVFLDGVGLGPADPESNPLATDGLLQLARLAGGQPWTLDAPPIRRPDHVFVPIDANLGVEGLPQSGTGQASLFTGVNCARLAGRHWGPFPHSSSKPVIAQHNLFQRLRRLGLQGTFANAFPARYSQMVAPKDRWTVTTRCCLDAGISLLDETDLRAGRALPADLSGATWRERLGIDIPAISPRACGHRLADLAQYSAMTLFEYFLTDKAGHSRDRGRADAVLADVNAFIGGLLDSLDPARDLLVVTSDHGNLENLASRGHTRHPVPLVALGPQAEAFAASGDLTDVAPAIMAVLAGARSA